MGLDILEQAPATQAVVVPMGGGGLISGVALALKTQRPDIRVIGVEPENVPNCTAALAAGGPVDVVCKPTLADGLAVRRMGNLAFELVQKLVDRIVTVSEAEIALAILRLVELEKGVVEGAGATPLAAAMAGKLPDLAGQRVVLTLCGGNIDPTILSRVIEKGLVADGRLSRFTAVLRDRPGSLADFAALIGDAGASIKDVVHDRAFSGPDVSSVNVLCVVETHDREHVAELHRRLRAAGVEFVVHDRA
jgi:threonine dehydratase